jgi:hypothetical protein
MAESISRRTLFARVLAAVPLAAAGSALVGAQTPVPITINKDPGCGCCEKWVAHMRAGGFAPTVHDTADMKTVKGRYKVPGALESCHTGIVGAYVIEGHVPAADVKALLARKPAGVAGLSIPGMPASAPGMDGRPFTPYTVLAFDAAGKTTTFATHTS